MWELVQASVLSAAPPSRQHRRVRVLWRRTVTAIRIRLAVIFDGFRNSAVLVSYRYDEPSGSDVELGLDTPLGIGIGDTVADLINAYTEFAISFEVIDAKDHFRISDGQNLLLWGPVSSVDPAGSIEGIYSATACKPKP